MLPRIRARIRPRIRFVVVLAVGLCLVFSAACAGRAPLDGAAPGPAAGPEDTQRPAHPATHPGTLLDGQGDILSEAAFVEAAARADLVLLGESHASPCDHAQQARLIRLMAEAGNPPAVGLEMIPVTLQPRLDRINAGEVALDEIEEFLGWADVWGYPFAAYRPVFETARDLDLPLFGLNVPFDVIRSISREGLFGRTPEERALVPLPIIEPAPAQMEKLREVFAMHGRPEADPERFSRFVLAQSLWDTAMAVNALAAHKATGRPVAVVTGGGHVEFSHGIARRAAYFAPAARVLTVMPWRGRTGQGVPEGFADVLYVCPSSQRTRLGLLLVQEEGGPVVVEEVVPGSVAERAGLLPGDVVVEAAGEPVTAFGDLHTAGMRAARENAPLSLVVERTDEAGVSRIAVELTRPRADE